MKRTLDKQNRSSFMSSSSPYHPSPRKEGKSRDKDKEKEKEKEKEKDQREKELMSSTSSGGETESVGLRTSTSIDSSLVLASKRKSIGPSPLTPNSSRSPGTPFVDSDPSFPENPFPSMEIADKEGGGIPPDMDESTKWLAQQLQTLTVFLKQEYAQRAYFERAIEQKFEELESNQKDLENRVMVLEATIAIKTIKKGTSKKKKETMKEKTKDQEKDQEKKPEVGVFRHRRTASGSSQPTPSPVSPTQANPLNSQSAPADELSLEGDVSLEDEEVQASDPKSKKKKKTTLRGDPRQKKKTRGFFGLITKDKETEQQDQEPEEEEKESNTLNASEAVPEVPKAQPRKYKKLMKNVHTPWHVKKDIFGIWEDIPMPLERALESGANAPPFMITSFTYLAQNLKEPKLFTTEFTHPEYQELLSSLQECQEKNTREDAFWGFQNPQFIGLLLRQYVRSFSESLTTAKLWQPLMEIGSIPDPFLREMLLRSAFLGLPQGYHSTLETLITFLTPYLKLHPEESEDLAKVFGNLLIANSPDEVPEAAAPYLTEERKDDVSPPVTPTASSTPRGEEVEEAEVEEDVPEGEKPKAKKNKKKEEGERRAERIGSDVRFAGVADKKIVSVTKVLKEKKPVFDEQTLKEFMKMRKTNVMETCLEHSEELFQLEGFDLEYFVDSTYVKKIMHASLRWLLLTLVDPVYPLMCDEVFISVMLFTHPYFFSSERFLGLLCKIYEDGNVEDAFVEEQHHQEKEHRKKMKEKVKRQMSGLMGGGGSGVKGKGGAVKLRKLKDKESVEQLTRQETEKEMEKEKEKEKLKKEEEKEEKEKDDDKGTLLSSMGSFGEDNRRLSGTNFDEDGDDKKKKRRRAKDKDKEKEKEAGDEEVKKLKTNVLREIRSLGAQKDPKKKKESKRDRKSRRDPLAGAPPGLNLSSPRPVSSPRVSTPSQSAEEPSQTPAARCLFPPGESGEDVVVGQTDDEPPVPIPSSDSSPPHSDFSASTPSNPPPPPSPTRSPSSPPLSRPRAKTSRDKFSTSPRMGTLGRRASPVRARLSSLSPRGLPSSPSSPRNKSSPKGRDGKSSSPSRSSSPNLTRQTQQTSSPVLGASPRGGKVGGRSTSPFLGASPMLSPRRGNSPRKSPDGFSTSSPITEAQDEGGNPVIDIPRRGRSLSSAKDNQIVMPPGTPPGTRNSTPRGKVPRKRRSTRPTSLKAPLDSPLSLKEEERRASGGPIEKEESSVSVKAIKQQMEKAIEESTTTKPRTSSDVQVGSVRNKWPHGRKEEEIEEEDKEGEKEEEKEGEKEGEEGEKEEEKEEKAKEEEIVKTPALDDEDSILEHTANAVAAVGGLTFDIEFDDKGSLTKLSDFDVDPSLLGPYSPQSSPRSVSKENDPPIAPSHEGKLVRNASSPAISVSSPDREEEGENAKKKEKKVEGAEGLWLDAVRMRVLVLLKKWLEEFMNVLITSEGFEKLLKSFITRFDSHETIENRELWQYVRMCGIKLGNTKAQLIRNISFYHNQPFNLKSATKLEVAQPTRQDILAFSAKDVAAQMTLIDQGMFKSIPWTEFIQKNFEKPQTGPFFNLMCDRWNQECHWVAGEVLTRSTANERSQMITYMITLGEECLTLKNFGMCFAVVAGLNLSAIARLKQTWDKLPKKWYARFHKLELLCSLENNYESYRSTYEAALKPKVPYIAVYPKDLTAIEDNIHTFIENTKMVNFNKLRLLWKLLKEIRETQRAVYNFPPNKMLHSTLKTLPGFTEKSLYDLSLKVEPRK